MTPQHWVDVSSQIKTAGDLLEGDLTCIQKTGAFVSQVWRTTPTRVRFHSRGGSWSGHKSRPYSIDLVIVLRRQDRLTKKGKTL
jgi:hypothetical protein